MNEPHNWTELIGEFLAWGDANPIKFLFIVWVIFVGVLKGLVSGKCHCKNCRNA